jgi:ParB/RepB/Spo0J family partition protein
MKVKINQIKGNPCQVRSIATSVEFDELTASIRKHGLLQPIKVRPVNGGYELVYGHRRLAAMKVLGWTESEAIVEGISDDDSLIQAIVENLQRQDLVVLDEAKSYKLLRDRGYTIKQIAETVNKSQGQITNRLSILRLPPEVQELVSSIQSQHASTTELGGLSADSASRISSAAGSSYEAAVLAEKVIKEGLNSREIRELTTVYKVATDTVEKKNLIEQPWRTEGNARGKSVTPFTRPAISSSTMFHRKIIWNLQRIGSEKFNHFTIGYSERSLEQFLELLKMARVNMLVDVRYNPVSQFRPEFSKSNLNRAITAVYIQYVHWPELGIPPEQRRDNDRDALFDWYLETVQPETILDKYKEVLENNRIAFMCVELDPLSCHRHCISLTLENKGYKLLDL